MASVFRVGIGLFVSSARLLPFFAAVLALYSGGPLSRADGGSAAQEIRPALEKLIAEGTAAAKQGDPKLALSRFQDAVPLAERSQDENLLGAALSGLGWSQWATGQYEAALQTRRRALEIFRKLDNPAREAVILRGLGETFYSLGRFDEALEHYQLALDANRRKPDAAEEASILSNIASTYRSQGRFEEAAAVLERSLKIARASGDRPAVAQALTFLGIVNRAVGEFDRALQFYREALTARRETDDRRGEAQVLGNMANVYLDLGQYDRSIELNRESLALAEKIGYAAQVGFAQQNLGAALSRIPKPTEALKFYELALDTFRRIGRRAQITQTLRSIGTLQAFVLKDEKRGRATLVEALDAATANGDREGEAGALYELGSLDVLAPGPSLNLERLDQALKIAREVHLPDLEYQVLANRGVALWRIGRADAAIADLRASAAIINDLRSNVGSDQLKIAYIDTRQSVFHDLATVLGGAGRPEEALEAAEAGRARAFADLLNQRAVHGRRDERAPLGELRTALSTDADTAQSTAAEKAGSGTMRGGRDPVHDALEKLREKNHELANLVTVESPKAEEIKAIAARLDATIVEYLVTNDALLAWVIPAAGPIRYARTGTRAETIEALVAQLRHGLESPSGQNLSRPDGLDPQLRELHALLIKPIAHWLPPNPRDTIVIVPHGATALVPFAALEDERGIPLVDRHTLATAPAISVFRYTPAKRRPGSSPRDALIITDPVPPDGSMLERLPGAQEEGRRVAARLGARAELLTGAAATESAVKAALPGRRILHFATHGLVSPIRPVASSLVLGKSAGDDGYLRVDEIFGLELKADLVVLSGCSTGLGRLTGDGVFGLTRAFIYAGTPSVIVSNWDVSDRSTAFLIDRFYAGLARGHGKAQALAAAQRETRRQFRHPSLWAAFVLSGEPR